MMKPSLTRQSTRISPITTGGSGLTRTAQKIYQHPAFEKVTLMIIVANAAWIAFDVDWNDGEGSQVPQTVFMIGENVFCVIFTMEIIIRILMYNNKAHFFTQPQSRKSNIFDFFLVSLMIIEIWILEPLSTTSGSLKQFSVVRVIRLLRLLRISRIFRMVPELGMMVKNMALAARSVSSTLLLEIGVMFVFAVIFTQWAKSHPNPCLAESDDESCALKDLFGTILKSFLTLMQILVFDDTFSIIRPILQDTWYMGCLLIFFMVLGSWTILNMLIGIICEIICTGTAEEKMKLLELRVREVFESIDLDGSGTVTREEFNGAGMKQMVNLGISKDVLESAFDILDEDGSGSFDIHEFLKMIFKLLTPPQSQDIQLLNQKMNQVAFKLNIAGSSSSNELTHAAYEPNPTGANSQHKPGSSLIQSDLNESTPHPFAPLDETPEDELTTDKESALLTTPEAQAQETYEKLEQLAQRADLVEGALSLVHGWRAWEKTGDEQAEIAFSNSSMQVAALHDVHGDYNNNQETVDLESQKDMTEHQGTATSNSMHRKGAQKYSPSRRRILEEYAEGECPAVRSSTTHKDGTQQYADDSKSLSGGHSPSFSSILTCSSEQSVHGLAA
eukprot:gnl/MRDRNA2_/MRDRNA2_79448_c0_seq3.p1 gnl/MRDRNA2_/MRDRNA2_79448_c0~~gnl/MRDRNA2_/MRDRNA2_79448_c0_seq3.p1  ORF type:complete len:616 (+),score=129.10 gnl/MRDRNA2_/MRDRNA2_79448_c0_seq3:75-1922(+)